MNTVYREAGRIRASDGTGYSDRVTDDEIRAHIAEAGDHSPQGFLEFAQAVLAIRAFERAAGPVVPRSEGASLSRRSGW